jgi:P27 family predicted phage terminase small subunit
MTQEQIQRRRDAEDAARGSDDTKSFHAPDWLPQELRGEFNTLRKELVDRKLMEKLDRDALGFYLVAREEYVQAGKRASRSIADGDLEGARDWSAIQDRYFKQARGCAADLGLTVTSRCRLVLPPKEEDEKDDLAEFLQRRRAKSEAV